MGGRWDGLAIIPKGLRPPAQGCEERATLGHRWQMDSTPTGLRPIRLKISDDSWKASFRFRTCIGTMNLFPHCACVVECAPDRSGALFERIVPWTDRRHLAHAKERRTIPPLLGGEISPKNSRIEPLNRWLAGHLARQEGLPAASPSPGGEGRGEGGRSSIPFRTPCPP